MAQAHKVLIVEDDQIVQMHLREVVRELGYQVCGVASTADEAMRCALASPPSLVIMDIRLRGSRDGIEVASELRAQCDPALVFLTAYADESTVQRALDVGAQGYVVKPFSKPQLRAAMSTAMAEHENRSQARRDRRALASVLGHRGDAVLVANADGRVTFLNPQASVLCGVSQREAIGGHLFDVLARVRGTPRGTAEPTAGEIRASGLVVRDAGGREVRADIERLAEAGADGSGILVVFRGDPGVAATASKPTSAAMRPFGAGTRLAIFSHDTLGLGHLQRCTNIAVALAARFPGLSVLLLTGSPAVHRYALPPGIDYVKLPSVRKVGAEKYEARSLGLSDDGMLRLRTNLILRSIQDYDPHVLLVDHAPAGMKGEMLPTLEWLGRHRPDCIKMIGLRDVLDEPEAVKALWSEQGTYDLLRDSYDHILVYGSPEIVDPAEAYGFSPELIAKTRYCNYVGEVGEEGARAAGSAGSAGARPLVAVTIGGGDGGGETVIGSYLEMLRLRGAGVGWDSVILPGPFLPGDLRERFEREARDLGVRILDFVPSTSPYIAQAEVVVCTGGYNTSAQSLRFGRKVLMIPRMMHRQEQFLRAKRLAELGLVTMLCPDEVTPQTLGDHVAAMLASPEQPLVEARAQNRIRFDGAERIAELCAGFSVREG